MDRSRRFCYLGCGLVVFDDGGALDQFDALLTRLFGFVTFAGVGDDFAVGGFESPTPFACVIFVDVEFHLSILLVILIVQWFETTRDNAGALFASIVHRSSTLAQKSPS